MANRVLILSLILVLATGISKVFACTNFIVSKGASSDQSVMIIANCGISCIENRNPAREMNQNIYLVLNTFSCIKPFGDDEIRHTWIELLTITTFSKTIHGPSGLVASKENIFGRSWVKKSSDGISDLAKE